MSRAVLVLAAGQWRRLCYDAHGGFGGSVLRWSWRLDVHGERKS